MSGHYSLHWAGNDLNLAQWRGAQRATAKVSALSDVGLFYPWEDKERLERGVTVSNDSRTLQDASPAGITHYMAGNGIELEPNMRTAHKFAVFACPERRGPERCRATTVLRAP